MKHGITSFNADIPSGSKLCITLNQLYIVGEVKNFNISEFNDKDELEIKVSVKNIKKLINGDNEIINETPISNKDLMDMIDCNIDEEELIEIVHPLPHDNTTNFLQFPKSEMSHKK